MGELCCYGWGNYEGTPVMGGEVVSFGYPFIMLLWVGKKETPSLCCIGGGVPLIWDSFWPSLMVLLYYYSSRLQSAHLCVPA